MSSVATKLPDPDHLVAHELGVRQPPLVAPLERRELCPIGLHRCALATIYPVDVEEAFGLVMAESLAWGTPVIALRRGAVPEVVEHPHTGFVVDDVEEMAAALAEVPKLERHACRQVVEERFSAEQLVASYENAFVRALSDA